MNNSFNQQGITKKTRQYLMMIIVCLTVILAGIIYLGINGDKIGKKADYERTIMIYMVGADLESDSALATADLDGLDYEKLDKQNTKVVAIIGGSSRWYNDYIDENTTSIYELTADGYKLVQEQGKENMGNKDVLSNFLNYAYENYSSKKYDLLFWNHGLGVLGNESDELTNDFLTTDEIKNALSNTPFNSKNKLELVLFRTCLNGTIELADTLKNYANYMVASQETTIGYLGNNFLKVLNDVKKSENGKQIGIKFTDSYMDYVNEFESSSFKSEYIYSTYSVLDLSKMSELEEALGEFVSDINLNSNYNQVARIRASLLQYGSEDETYDSVDLYTLVNSMKSLSPQKGDKVLKSLDKVIVYNKSTDNRSKGLSIYFPYKGTKEAKEAILSRYYNLDGLTKYKSFIVAFNKIQTTGNTNLNFSKNVVDLKKDTEKKESDFTLELTDEQKEGFATAEYIIFKGRGNGYYTPLYRGNNATLEGNTLKASVRDRQLAFTTSEGEKETILLREKEETNDYITYVTYVVLENLKDFNFDVGQLTLKLDKATNEVSIVSILKGSDKVDNKDFAVKKPYNIAVDLKDYTNVAFTHSNYRILDDNGNYNENWESNREMYGIEPKVEDLNFAIYDYNDEYEYYAIFVIVDVNNEVHYSNLVKMK